MVPTKTDGNDTIQSEENHVAIVISRATLVGLSFEGFYAHVAILFSILLVVYSPSVSVCLSGQPRLSIDRVYLLLAFHENDHI